MKHFRRLSTIIVLALLVAACVPLGNGGSPTPGQPGSGGTPGAGQTPAADTSPLTCPFDIQVAIQSDNNCQTPRSLRFAYGVEALMQRGYTGKGQTIVDIVSYNSPTLQQDMDTFDQEFGLPPITLKVMSPIGSVPFDANNQEMSGWADETNLDVQTIHAIAPGANIVVLTSPVDETEGTIGLPQYLELEQYAISHHLGSIISQSWGASEVTLKDSAGQQEIRQWEAFYQQATTQQGITFFASSGDNGATDYTDLNEMQLSTTPTTSFPPDDPWVTSTGGTELQRTQDGGFSETAWNDSGGASGGGFSAFFPTPSYQQSLPPSVQQVLNHRRGVPDVAADADPTTALAVYSRRWQLIGGTSAAAPLWAAIAAIANQVAGHPLGFLNTALYKLAASSTYARDFHDITEGNNSVRVHGTPVPGYNAAPGWDPVTGLGSPDAENLVPDLIAAIGAG
jgi:subtilase family serine protease